MPYIITRQQRDALREEAIASLAEIGDVYLAIENDDWPLAELLSTRNATVLELLHDLGWEPDKVTSCGSPPRLSASQSSTSARSPPTGSTPTADSG